MPRAELHRFGMSTKADRAVRIHTCADHDERIRAPGVLVVQRRTQLGACKHRQTRDQENMSSLIVPRREFLRGLASAAVCAPAVVRASSLMAISAKFCGSTVTIPPWASAQEALAWLQHEMERRFAETVFGQEGLLAEAEGHVPTRNPVLAEAKITALWELRTRFGPRGSPSTRLEELPADVWAGLCSIVGASSGAYSEVDSAPFWLRGAPSALRSI